MLGLGPKLLVFGALGFMFTFRAWGLGFNVPGVALGLPFLRALPMSKVQGRRLALFCSSGIGLIACLGSFGAWGLGFGV